MTFSGAHLGDFVLENEPFPGLEKVLNAFHLESFRALNEKQKREKVNRTLYDLINKAKEPCFLLGCVTDFIDKVLEGAFLEHYHFSHFEFWLNQSPEISSKENYRIRAKIIGKALPREEYQIFFPIGMGKTYPGPHYVTAHGSPDVDTTIASFWGWVDAFGARVSEGLHMWNVPGGMPAAPVEMELLFFKMFGHNVFSHLAKNHTSLLLSSFDLVSQKGMIEKQQEDSMFNIEYERNHHAVILVDDEGYYLGDWRNIDVEGVRQVIESFHLCLRWFENRVYTLLISLFSKEKVTRADFENFLRSVCDIALKDSEPAKKFTKKQRKHLQDYLSQVLHVRKGFDCTFEEFAAGMKELSVPDFHDFLELLKSLAHSPLFDKSGELKENRPILFNNLDRIIRGLDQSLQSIDNYVDRLAVSLDIKTHVFGYIPQTVNYRADIGEVRSKMASYSYLTVTYADKDGKQIPLGVVHAQELYKPILGTVSLRDFCNREETKIPTYLEIISVIDHHKSSFSSVSAPVIHISDSQSSNAILAELAFAINDRYSTAGMIADQVRAQIKEIENNLGTPSNKRILRRLLQRMVAGEKDHEFFVDQKREFCEYLHFLYAILDDTDLLTKVSLRDVICMASLLNRLKSLMMKKEVEIVHFDDLPRDEKFVEAAAKRILQNVDMYSLCRRIYHAKEETVTENLKLCATGQPSNFFSDTKEQNGCCRVGQAKLYAVNFPVYEKYADTLRKLWFETSVQVAKDKKEIDLYIQMISTVAGAEDLFAGMAKEYTHKDELWIWIPDTELAVSHLKSFLNALRSVPLFSQINMEVEFLGDNAPEMAQIFQESFLPIPQRMPKKKGGLPIVVLHFKAGAINSRKAMISPYLPRQVT